MCLIILFLKMPALNCIRCKNSYNAFTQKAQNKLANLVSEKKMQVFIL